MVHPKRMRREVCTTCCSHLAVYREVTVPIYDGRATDNRAAFNFSDADFRRLLSWPLYRDNEEELPLEAVVTVSYTVSKYTSKSGKINLSSNVLFVVVLSVPSGSE
jgi:hypothetical protein